LPAQARIKASVLEHVMRFASAWFCQLGRFLDVFLEGGYVKRKILRIDRWNLRELKYRGFKTHA